MCQEEFDKTQDQKYLDQKQGHLKESKRLSDLYHSDLADDRALEEEV